MLLTTLECCECRASCVIHHDLDEDHYEIEACPFCGSDQIEHETEEDLL